MKLVCLDRQILMEGVDYTFNNGGAIQLKPPVSKQVRSGTVRVIDTAADTVLWYAATCHAWKEDPNNASALIPVTPPRWELVPIDPPA